MTEITWTSEIPLDRAEKIDPLQICAYFERNGWKRRADGPERLAIYMLIPTDDEMIVPFDRKYADYLRRIQEVIVTIARVEMRPIGDVLREFLPDPLPARTIAIIRLNVKLLLMHLRNLPDASEAVVTVGEKFLMQLDELDEDSFMRRDIKPEAEQ